MVYLTKAHNDTTSREQQQQVARPIQADSSCVNMVTNASLVANMISIPALILGSFNNLAQLNLVPNNNNNLDKFLTTTTNSTMATQQNSNLLVQSNQNSQCKPLDLSVSRCKRRTSPTSAHNDRRTHEHNKALYLSTILAQLNQTTPNIQQQQQVTNLSILTNEFAQQQQQQQQQSMHDATRLLSEISSSISPIQVLSSSSTSQKIDGQCRFRAEQPAAQSSSSSSTSTTYRDPSTTTTPTTFVDPTSSSSSPPPQPLPSSINSLKSNIPTTINDINNNKLVTVNSRRKRRLQRQQRRRRTGKLYPCHSNLSLGIHDQLGTTKTGDCGRVSSDRQSIDDNDGNSMAVVVPRRLATRTPKKKQKNHDDSKILKAHLCHDCGRSFARSDMLTRHSRLHSGVKPYQCNKCHQVFSRSDHLTTHDRTHTGEKPFHCQHCSYSACRRDMITRHMRTHSSTTTTGSRTSSP